MVLFEIGAKMEVNNQIYNEDGEILVVSPTSESILFLVYKDGDCYGALAWYDKRRKKFEVLAEEDDWNRAEILLPYEEAIEKVKNYLSK